jgi:hypothetical protein
MYISWWDCTVYVSRKHIDTCYFRPVIGLTDTFLTVKSYIILHCTHHVVRFYNVFSIVHNWTQRVTRMDSWIFDTYHVCNNVATGNWHLMKNFTNVYTIGEIQTLF